MVLGTEGLAYARQMFHHWVTPAPECIVFFWNSLMACGVERLFLSCVFDVLVSFLVRFLFRLLFSFLLGCSFFYSWILWGLYKFLLGVVAHFFNPCPRDQGQEDFCEFKNNLIYIASSRSAKVLQLNHISKRRILNICILLIRVIFHVCFELFFPSVLCSYHLYQNMCFLF